MPSNVENDPWPFDVLDHEREQNGANPMRMAGTVVCIGHLASPVRHTFPAWMVNTGILDPTERAYAVKLDRDGTLWWFDNIVQKNPFRSDGSLYRPYVHWALDDAATDHIAMAKQITMCGGEGPLPHFPVGWKVSFVAFRAHQLRCNDEGKPIVLQKCVSEEHDCTWPLTLPDMTVGVACEIVQDLGVHQPNKEIQAGPVLSFRRHCPRLPTRVSAA